MIAGAAPRGAAAEEAVTTALEAEASEVETSVTSNAETVARAEEANPAAKELADTAEVGAVTVAEVAVQVEAGAPVIASAALPQTAASWSNKIGEGKVTRATAVELAAEGETNKPVVEVSAATKVTSVNATGEEIKGTRENRAAAALPKLADGAGAVATAARLEQVEFVGTTAAQGAKKITPVNPPEEASVIAALKGAERNQAAEVVTEGGEDRTGNANCMEASEEKKEVREATIEV